MSKVIFIFSRRIKWSGPRLCVGATLLNEINSFMSPAPTLRRGISTPPTCIKDPRLTTTRDGIHPVVDFDIARSAVRQRRTMSKFTTGFFVKVLPETKPPPADGGRGLKPTRQPLRLPMPLH